MAWTPAHSATDVKPIVENLLTFFETHQTEALAWASPDRLLADFTKFYRTAQSRSEKDFPHFGVVTRRVATDDADDGLRVEYTLVFEIEVEAEFAEADMSTALAQLDVDTDGYRYAVESMFLNIPDDTLFAGVTGARHGYRSITSSEPLAAAAGHTKAMFQQQMTAVLRFTENP